MRDWELHRHTLIAWHLANNGASECWVKSCWGPSPWFCAVPQRGRVSQTSRRVREVCCSALKIPTQFEGSCDAHFKLRGRLYFPGCIANHPGNNNSWWHRVIMFLIDIPEKNRRGEEGGECVSCFPCFFSVDLWDEGKWKQTKKLATPPLEPAFSYERSMSTIRVTYLKMSVTLICIKWCPNS